MGWRDGEVEGRRDRQRVPNGELQGASRSQEMDVRGWAGQTVKTQVSQMRLSRGLATTCGTVEDR